MDRPDPGTSRNRRDASGRLSPAADPPSPPAGDELARCRFPPPGTPVVCAVSGGADSVALALLAVTAGCDVTVAHVDHELRPDSPADAVAVADLARDLDVPFVLHRRPVEDGPDLEARARRIRHAALGPTALFGHTADDVAETVLWNLLRGAGPTGGSPLIDSPRHPLTGLRRHETRAVCERAGIVWREDSTNTSPSFTRNRIRHEALPLLADIARRDVVTSLVRHAELSAELAAFADHVSRDLDPTDAAAVAAAPRAVARAAIRRWLMTETGDAYGPELAAVDRVLEVARGTWRATEVGGGVAVSRRGGRLRIDATGGGRVAPE